MNNDKTRELVNYKPPLSKQQQKEKAALYLTAPQTTPARPRRSEDINKMR